MIEKLVLNVDESSAILILALTRRCDKFSYIYLPVQTHMLTRIKTNKIDASKQHPWRKSTKLLQARFNG